MVLIPVEVGIVDIAVSCMAGIPRSSCRHFASYPVRVRPSAGWDSRAAEGMERIRREGIAVVGSCHCSGHSAEGMAVGDVADAGESTVVDTYMMGRTDPRTGSCTMGRWVGRALTGFGLTARHAENAARGSQTV